MKNWNIEELTGYKPITTFYTDFSIADKFGVDAIKDTYNKAFNGWNHDYKYITELAMVLNWKSFEHEKNKEYCELYCDLYEELDSWCYEHFTEQQRKYYFETTD